MNPLESGVKELKDLSANPTGDNLLAFFRARTKGWDYPVVDIGVATVGICNGLVAAIEPKDALTLLPDTAKFLLTLNEPSRIDQALDMLSDLVTASETNVPPIGFELLMDDLEKKIVQANVGLGVWKYINRQYART